MYLTVDETTYTQLQKISFAPEADVSASKLNVNDVAVDVLTTDSIPYGVYAELYNDLGTRFARYWIKSVERIDRHTVRVKAQSEIALLDGVTLPAVMYENEPLADVLEETIVRQSGAGGIVAPLDYTLDTLLANETITGFCPEQTARERLQWVLLAVGAYVKTFFCEGIEIHPIPTSSKLVRMEHTFYKPSVSYGDFVTAVRVKSYSFHEGTEEEQQAMSDQASYIFPLPWVAEEQTLTLVNPAAPIDAPENIVDIDEVYLVNPSNASLIMTRLSQYYFNRTKVDLDAIDNGEYFPGQRAIVYTDEGSLCTGYITSASFQFGKQAKAGLHLEAVETSAGAWLNVVYECDDVEIGRNRYYLPVGYEYEITNPYLDITADGHRRVYRPITASITGTLPTGGDTVTVDYAVALDHFEGILRVNGVDSITISGTETAVLA